jgi:hypothetical protein
MEMPLFKQKTKTANVEELGPIKVPTLADELLPV